MKLRFWRDTLVFLAVLWLMMWLCGCEPVMVKAKQQPREKVTCRRTLDGRSVCPSKVQDEAVKLRSQLLGDESEGIAPNLLDLPPSMRTANYGGGSCAHAAIVDLFRWHGFNGMADWWRNKRRGAYGIPDGVEELAGLGWSVAYTTDGDAEFLEWCSRNRHGAAIRYDTYGPHALTFRGFVGEYACLQDNNFPNRLKMIGKDAFVRKWQNDGGDALTLVYSPEPPIMVP